MKYWEIILLIMIVIRVVVFTFLYFNCLKDFHKTYSKYDTMHEWVLIIMMVIFFSETHLIFYLIEEIGILTTKCDQLIYDIICKLAHKICKKFYKKDKK